MIYSNIIERVKPYPANNFIQIVLSAYYTCCIYSNALQITFIMEVNNMNPEETAPKGSSLLRVHSVCNVGYQTTSSDEKADNNCHE